MVVPWRGPPTKRVIAKSLQAKSKDMEILIDIGIIVCFYAYFRTCITYNCRKDKYETTHK